eukprot:COSAG06_NODE_39000_length_417_cov_1.078616_2_plen_61_part_01
MGAQSESVAGDRELRRRGAARGAKGTHIGVVGGVVLPVESWGPSVFVFSGCFSPCFSGHKG